MEASTETGGHAADARRLSRRSHRRRGRRIGTGALPTLVVIGAQKCGTSTLHYYLGLHPQISMSRPKELNFFVAERNWPQGVDWYRSHFDPAVPVRGESSPNYTTYPHHKGIPERMHAVVPNAKLIFMVRDPLERIEAHWVHNYAKRRERGTVAETIMHPDTTYLIRSRYFMQLQRFLEHYDRSQILVLEQHDLLRRRHETLRSVFQFLGVDADFDNPSFDVQQHRTVRKRRATRLGLRIQRLPDTTTANRLLRRTWGTIEILAKRPIQRPDIAHVLPREALLPLREDAGRLRELTGRRFENWTIWDV